MKETRLLMGMPVTIEVVEPSVTAEHIDQIFRTFEYVDATFSTYKEHSEISRINRGELSLEEASDDMRTIFELAEQTRIDTDGYFDIRRGDQYDPLGIVKGWAIYQAAERLHAMGFRHFYVDAGGDAQISGLNAHGELWRLGIRNPFQPAEAVKLLALSDCGVATSGTYLRGNHIYNPMGDDTAMQEIVSLTVIGPNVYEADRYATAAFAMGRDGIGFIEMVHGLEGYLIDRSGRATMTSGLRQYLALTPLVEGQA